MITPTARLDRCLATIWDVQCAIVIQLLLDRQSPDMSTPAKIATQAERIFASYAREEQMHAMFGDGR